VAARIDQVVYRGFVSHYYLKTAGGEQIVVFEQNQSQQGGLRYAVGQDVVARWTTPSNHLIARH
jgi:putative spermidine/putrescine transport system ATP-binding protein/spermidine/putrescine transport system ATP-binding protein